MMTVPTMWKYVRDKEEKTENMPHPTYTCLHFLVACLLED